ncbi:MAG: hypothetical protein LBE35_07480 [Clostridiales bacterium]|nr:hypothetical protein [Clostridiales bacterium]
MAYSAVVERERLAEILDLPPQLEGDELNIVVWDTKKKVGSSYGYFNKYANPDLVEYESEAWADAVVEKYVEKKYSAG